MHATWTTDGVWLGCYSCDIIILRFLLVFVGDEEPGEDSMGNELARMSMRAKLVYAAQASKTVI